MKLYLGMNRRSAGILLALFTGLRIGAAVVNTLAHELNIPLYDHHGTRQKIILPDYGRPANISAPKK